MKKLLAVCLSSFVCTLTVAQDSSGLVTRPSKYSVAETAARLQAAVEASGAYKVFYQLDHRSASERAVRQGRRK